MAELLTLWVWTEKYINLQGFLLHLIISISPLQVFNWSEVSTEAELVVFSTLLAIQHFNRRIDGEHTPPNTSLTPTWVKELLFSIKKEIMNRCLPGIYLFRKWFSCPSCFVLWSEKSTIIDKTKVAGRSNMIAIFCFVVACLTWKVGASRLLCRHGVTGLYLSLRKSTNTTCFNCKLCQAATLPSTPTE